MSHEHQHQRQQTNNDANHVQAQAQDVLAVFHKYDTDRSGDIDASELRVALLQEELDELKEAIAKNDLIEVADALADLQYVLSGTVHEFGMGSRFASLFDEVHRSNMSKACATRDEAEATVAHYAARNQPAQMFEQPDGSFLVKRIADDKVLKSINYSEPRLGAILHRRPPAPASDSPGARRLNQGIF